MMVGGATVLGFVFSSERKKFPMQAELLLLIGLWIQFAISTTFAISPEKALARFIFVSKILIVPFLCTSLLTNESRLQWLLRVIGLSLGFHGLKGGFFAVVCGGNFLVWGPEESFLFANNAIGMALAMNVPLLIYLQKSEKSRWLRNVVRVMLLFSYPAVVCTFSRGAWIALALVTALSVLKSRHRFLIGAVATVVLFLALPVLPSLLPERVVGRYDTLENYQEDDSAQSRFWNWEFCKRVGMAHPLTGGGFEYYGIKQYRKYYPEFLARWPGKFWSCHSMWLTIFGEHGFPGMILWICLLVSSFFSLRRIRRRAAEAGVQLLADRANMVEASLVAYLTAGTFLDIAYFEMFYSLIAVLVVLKERASELVPGGPPPVLESRARSRPLVPVP